MLRPESVGCGTRDQALIGLAMDLVLSRRGFRHDGRTTGFAGHGDVGGCPHVTADGARSEKMERRGDVLVKIHSVMCIFPMDPTISSGSVVRPPWHPPLAFQTEVGQEPSHGIKDPLRGLEVGGLPYLNP